jgi:hypothetical protein
MTRPLCSLVGERNVIGASECVQIWRALKTSDSEQGYCLSCQIPNAHSIFGKTKITCQGVKMKTFLLGCGAQKAGTTWLANKLSSSPEYWNGGIKEWRFWKFYFENEYSRLRQIDRMKKRLLEIPASGKHLSKPKLEWRILALQNPESFLQDIVDDFLEKGNAKVLGDMTPSNGTLGIDKLTFIKEYFNNRGINVKPLFIMRDPFERIWSGVRMIVRNQYSEKYKNNEHFACEKLLETYRTKKVEQRTRYEHIVENLETVFGVQNICYEFSERLFSQDGLDRVTKHLGISKLNVDLKSPNPSPKIAVVPTQVRYEVISFYKDTYLSIFDKFGCDVKEYWSESFKLML